LRLDLRDLRHGQVFGDRKRLRTGELRRLLVPPRRDLLRWKLEDLSEKELELLTALFVALDERLHDHAVDLELVGGLVVREDLACAVHDQAALGRHLDLAQGIGLREAAVLLCLNALHEPERSSQEHEGRHDAPEDGVDAELEELLIVSIYAHGSGPVPVTCCSDAACRSCTVAATGNGATG